MDQYSGYCVDPKIVYNFRYVNKQAFWIAIIFALISSFGLIGNPALAQSADYPPIFPGSGHQVTGKFLEKYSSIPNGQELFGDPITDAYIDEHSGLLVQYFEKARFELHPDEPEEFQVKLTPLGEFLYESGDKVSIPENFPSCHLFRETGQSVCYAFLDFFEENGGVLQFGYPISGFEIHDGWISQYFQRARLEWHPERKSGNRVVVANLGAEYFNFRDEDPILLQPNLANNIPRQGVFDLQVHAFVSKPFLPILGNHQELYVIVYDQTYRPLENAIISYVITLPSGKVTNNVMPPTNEQGLSTQVINISGESVGTAKIVVTVTFGTLQEQSRTSFQIW